MTSFAEIVHAVFNSPTTARPGRLLRSLPHIVRRIFPHVRYSPSLETLVAGSHPSSASAHKMPPSPIQDEVPFKTSTTHGKVYSLHTGIWPQLHTLCSHPDDLVFRILYKPHGKFAWMDGQTIKDVKVLKWLGGECHVDAAHVQLTERTYVLRRCNVFCSHQIWQRRNPTRRRRGVCHLSFYLQNVSNVIFIGLFL